MRNLWIQIFFVLIQVKPGCSSLTYGFQLLNLFLICVIIHSGADNIIPFLRPFLKFILHKVAETLLHFICLELMSLIKRPI